MSREEIIDAAMRAVHDGTFEQLSIRSLAAELGAAPMTLYRYVRDKDDLLDEVVDRLLADTWRPAAPADCWTDWITKSADRLRRFLVAQPVALHVYLRHPVVSPAAVERMNAMLAVLQAAGATDNEARRAYAAIHTYTIGFAALEASRAGWTPPEGKPIAAELAAYTTPKQFTTGLTFLLDGIGRHAPRLGPPLESGVDVARSDGRDRDTHGGLEDERGRW